MGGRRLGEAKPDSSMLSTGRRLSPEFQESLGEFLSGASRAWGSSGYIPMYPTCDAEFEESITHDAISIKLGVPDPDKYGGSLSGEYSCTSWPSPMGLHTYDGINEEKGLQKMDWTSAIVRGD